MCRCCKYYFAHAVINILLCVQNEVGEKQSLSSKVTQLEKEQHQLQVSLYNVFL